MTDEPDQQSESPKPPFDPIFPRLVKEEGSGQKVLGFIAYGLFQEAKREWISDSGLGRDATRSMGSYARTAILDYISAGSSRTPRCN
jgi:hypothetical protein